MSPESSLAGFELAWRWTDPEHDVLPSDALATIRPMSPLEARAFAAEASARFEPAPVADYDLSILAEWDDAEAVRLRLEALPVSSEAEIIVRWRPELAVRTLWSTFVRHWDSFCYPSSDERDSVEPRSGLDPVLPALSGDSVPGIGAAGSRTRKCSRQAGMGQGSSRALPSQRPSKGCVDLCGR